MLLTFCHFTFNYYFVCFVWQRGFADSQLHCGQRRSWLFSVRQRVSMHNKVFTKLKRENHDRTSSFSRAHDCRAIGHMFHSQDWTKTKDVKIQWSLGIMNLHIVKSSVEKTILFISVIVKYIEKNLFIMKPYYSEQILPLSWHLIMLRFHCSMRNEGTVFACKWLDLHGAWMNTKKASPVWEGDKNGFLNSSTFMQNTVTAQIKYIFVTNKFFCTVPTENLLASFSDAAFDLFCTIITTDC